MIEYRISYKNPNRHIVDIEVTIAENKDPKIWIILPSWRPGRYELANYAKNIYRMEAFASGGQSLSCEKVRKDMWEINTNGESRIVILYQYYAFQMDAGNSYLDDEQLYINPINCLIYVEERIKENCRLKLDISPSYKIATGLKQSAPFEFLASDYYELADSPFIASSTLKCLNYSVNNINFFIWLQGRPFVDEERLLRDFKDFTVNQIEMMKGFPEQEFHFLIQLLPYAFRHGVEHRNSTVITIGPDYQIDNLLYKDLVGISSHELFHCWNVLKIRPKEMLPYHFNRENYFRTGYIAEGFTTYYGDLILARSKVFTIEDYLQEFNDLLRKHFQNGGNLNQSLAESSFDLWLDGYTAGIPDRKVSIYIKGALVAFLLDVMIRKSTDNIFSLDDVMLELWKEYGAKGIGYDESTISTILLSKFNVDVNTIIHEGVYCRSFLEEELNEAFDFLGLELTYELNAIPLESKFGIKCLSQNNRWIIDQINQKSPAINLLSKSDELVAINNQRFDPLLPIPEDTIELTIVRGTRAFTIQLIEGGLPFYSNPYLKLKKNITQKQKENLKKWLGTKE